MRRFWIFAFAIFVAGVSFASLHFVVHASTSITCDAGLQCLPDVTNPYAYSCHAPQVYQGPLGTGNTYTCTCQAGTPVCGNPSYQVCPGVDGEGNSITSYCAGTQTCDCQTASQTCDPAVCNSMGNQCVQYICGVTIEGTVYPNQNGACTQAPTYNNPNCTGSTPQCTQNSDCSGGQVCVAEQCVASTGNSATQQADYTVTVGPTQ